MILSHLHGSWTVSFREGQEEQLLVGSFNPFEKYYTNWIIFPSTGENKNIWNNHLDYMGCPVGFITFHSSQLPPRCKSKRRSVSLTSWWKSLTSLSPTKFHPKKLAQQWRTHQTYQVLYLNWRNPHLYKLYGYGLCKGKHPTQKIAWKGSVSPF